MSTWNEAELVFAAARADDAEAMRQLARDAYGVYVSRLGREPAPMIADYEAIASSGQALLVWRADDLVGMLVTRIEPEALLVENIAVSSRVQGTGLGSRLLVEAERLARAAGRAEVRLYTNEVMTENLEYYPRRGYRETHRTAGEYRRVHFSKRVHGA